MKFPLPTLALFAALATTGLAQTVERPLPDAHLNNAAGSSRSNVAWSTGGYVDSQYRYALGDSFKLGEGFQGNYRLDSLSLWVVDDISVQNPTQYSLLLGAGSSSTVVLQSLSLIPTITQVSYADSNGYQGYSGRFYPLYQLDFNFSNWTFNANDTVFFGLVGFGGPMANGPESFFSPFLHASNAALSGTPQYDADNRYLAFQSALGSSTYTYEGAYNSQGDGWDKSSDMNFSAHVTPVPEPSTYGMLGAGALVGLGFMRRLRRNRKA